MQYALAQLSLLAIAGASLRLQLAPAAREAQLVQHKQQVLAVVFSVQLDALQGNTGDQAKLLGFTAVGLGLLPTSALYSLPLQPAAIVQACRLQLNSEMDPIMLQFDMEAVTALNEQVQIRCLVCLLSCTNNLS